MFVHVLVGASMPHLKKLSKTRQEKANHMKAATIVGTRPEFIQIRPLTHALRGAGYTEILVNSGQHYDDNMSHVFFRDLELPQPDIYLEVGSGSHAYQTGQMMMRIEDVLTEEKPDFVAVYGDTNTTIAATLVASKLHIPVVHVESGLRSFDKKMPEEVNRIVTDHLSDILFSPTEVAVQNLENEGITEGVHNVGDVRVDILLDLQKKAQGHIIALRQKLEIPQKGEYALATIHRAENTDYPDRLADVLTTIGQIPIPVILPVHPRLHRRMSEFDLQFSANVIPVDPVGYFDMITLISSCRILVTDSGGLQKESYILKRPTITLRDSTEWTETIDAGWNRLCEPNQEEFASALTVAMDEPPASHPNYYGEYGVGKRMLKILEDAFGT